VHRDIKPGNVMWLPSQNRWTVIDFGCAAHIGTEAPTGYSLLYAAPEVVRAHVREGAKSFIATCALDSWSLGVLAVELFLGRHAMRMIDGRDEVFIHCTANWPVSNLSCIVLHLHSMVHCACRGN
jgi:serine/threonine protein kinase